MDEFSTLLRAIAVEHGFLTPDLLLSALDGEHPDTEHLRRRFAVSPQDAVRDYRHRLAQDLIERATCPPDSNGPMSGTFPDVPEWCLTDVDEDGTHVFQLREKVAQDSDLLPMLYASIEQRFQDACAYAEGVKAYSSLVSVVRSLLNLIHERETRRPHERQVTVRIISEDDDRHSGHYA